jgi:hypothetical protein
VHYFLIYDMTGKKNANDLSGLPTTARTTVAMRSSCLTAVFVFGVVLNVAHCEVPKEYTVHVGNQATITGYEYSGDHPALFFAGIPYAQPMTSTNRFMVSGFKKNCIYIIITYCNQKYS